MKENYLNCPVCNSYPMQIGKTTYESNYQTPGGDEITVHDVEVFFCCNCGEEVLASQENKRIDRVIAKARGL